MQLALELINSEEWYGRGRAGLVDHLQRPGRLEELLERWGLSAAGTPTAAQRMQLVALRRLLRSMFTALSEGAEPTGEELEELDRALAAALFRRRIVPEGAGHELDPVRRDWGWVLSEVASSFTELLDAERGRVKLCENPECRWAFYDASKNRRRRWCDPAECGNVFKVREFRARRRAASAS